MWTGPLASKSRSSVLVRLGRGSERLWTCIDIPSLDSLKLASTSKATALSPGSRCVVFPSEGDVGHMRLASVLGVVPYSTPSLGIGSRSVEPSVRRIVGLDIEQSTSARPYGFPLAPIMMEAGSGLAALFCTPYLQPIPTTYKDSVVVSSILNEYGVFDTIGNVAHPVPSYVRGVEIGSKLSPDTHDWWRPADVGTVLHLRYGTSKEQYVIAEMNSTGVRVGDKLATQHGQKQTVSRVLQHSDMPICVNTKSGAMFRPHIIMAASSVHNRLTPGQIYESRAGALACNVATFDPRMPSNSHITTMTGSDASAEL